LTKVSISSEQYVVQFMSENSIYGLKGFAAACLELEAPEDSSNTQCHRKLDHSIMNITNDISCRCDAWRDQ
jgi:hypothetical protein